MKEGERGGLEEEYRRKLRDFERNYKDRKPTCSKRTTS